MKFYQLLGLMCFFTMLSIMHGKAQVRFISPDTTFDNGGHFVNPKQANYFETVSATDVQTDGKIVINVSSEVSKLIIS